MCVTYYLDTRLLFIHILEGPIGPTYFYSYPLCAPHLLLLHPKDQLHYPDPAVLDQRLARTRMMIRSTLIG